LYTKTSSVLYFLILTASLSFSDKIDFAFSTIELKDLSTRLSLNFNTSLISRDFFLVNELVLVVGLLNRPVAQKSLFSKDSSQASKLDHPPTIIYNLIVLVTISQVLLLRFTKIYSNVESNLILEITQFQSLGSQKSLTENDDSFINFFIFSK